MQDPRSLLLADIDLESLRLEPTPHPIVLLCGGFVNPDSSSAPSSLRCAITRRFTDFELFRPEEITDWHTDAVFKNLVDFEVVLAGICSLVVIILESPGSFAELGAFSQLKELRDKLIVVESDMYSDEQSFINLGILRRISEGGSGRVRVYPWKVGCDQRPASIPEETINDSIDDIQKELGKIRGSQVWSSKNTAHVLALIHTLLRIFVALKQQEIIDYLKFFGVDMSKDSIRSRLFLLNRFQLIEIYKYSDSTFYISRSDEFHKIRLSSKSKVKIDTLRSQVSCIEYYATTKSENHRSRAIAKFKAEKSK